MTHENDNMTIWK